MNNYILASTIIVTESCGSPDLTKRNDDRLKLHNDLLHYLWGEIHNKADDDDEIVSHVEYTYKIPEDIYALLKMQYGRRLTGELLWIPG